MGKVEGLESLFYLCRSYFRRLLDKSFSLTQWTERFRKLIHLCKSSFGRLLGGYKSGSDHCHLVRIRMVKIFSFLYPTILGIHTIDRYSPSACSGPASMCLTASGMTSYPSFQWRQNSQGKQ